MLRRFLEFAIDRPLLNHMFLIFIVVLSIYSYTNIPKEIFPSIAKDQISISGGYPGSSADILDKMAVTTIEDSLKNIQEIELVKTIIKNGFFSIQADIKTGSENIQVLSDVKDVLDSLKRDLPADMSDPSAKIFTHTVPLLLVAISGEDVTNKELLDRAEDLKTKLSNFENLSEITIRGDADSELVVTLNKQKIRAYNLDYNLVLSSLGAMSSIFPIGTIEQNGEHLYISTYNGAKEKSEVENIILSVGDRYIKVGEIADVAFGLSDRSEISHYNGLRNVSVNVTKSNDGNAIALTKQIRTLLEKEELENPRFQLNIYTDTSIWIKNRLNTVFANITFGLMLVFIAMLIFVNRGIAFVVALGIPLSFMIGLIAADSFGYSLNMLTLLGALIALGMLVDEAIVVAENIYRHLEEGKSRREAVIEGAAEMFPAVLTATLTTVFAFIPLLMLTGDMGSFIKVLPIIITVLLLSSLFEAFYFLPLHANDFLKVRKDEHMSHKIWDKIYSIYDRVIHFVFKKSVISLVVIVMSILISTGIMIKNSKFQLFPDFDATQLFVNGKVNINNNLEDTEKLVSALEEVLLEKLSTEEYTSVTSVVGMRLDAKNRAEMGENLFQIFIDLHEKAPDNFFNKYINPILSIEYDAELLKRERKAQLITKDIMLYLQKFKTLKVEGANVYEELNIIMPKAGVVAHDVEIALSGKNDKEIVAGLTKLSTALENIEGVYNVEDDASLGEKELKLKVNSYGQRLGFNEQVINRELSSYYLKGERGKMFTDEGLLRIRLEGDRKDQLNSIYEYQVQIPRSQNYVALKDVCNFIMISSFVSIKKENGLRQRSVFASLDKELITSSQMMSELKTTLKELKEDGLRVYIKGEQEENDKNKSEMTKSAVVALFLIFITLVWMFNSIAQSLIVISTIPLTLLGVFAGHFIMGINMTMPGLIGIVGLMGVVVNDGLLMVSFIKKAQDVEHLIKLAKTRLRPILLTSLTTVLGLSTLIFFASGQAQILQPMAISLGFGILWATFLNMVYVPLLYKVVYRVK
ncbi:MAG: MMPL family transporter [Helicobacteraceae bacterium]|nr:MMPL family transporter [Helicobacteraceae bacterium]